MITLNGETVPGHNMQLRCGFRLADEELSGQSASTARAEQGIKPQTLNVTLDIMQNAPDELTRLISMVRAVDINGVRTVYSIVNDLAAACKVHYVVFTDNFTVNESDSVRIWRVNFVLAERESRAEVIEGRQESIKPNSAANTTDFNAISAQIDEQVES